MKIGRYILRAVKYFVKLVVLLGLILALMRVSGTSTLGEGEGLVGFFQSFFATSKGMLFAVAVAVWCLVYPTVEFVTRHMKFDMNARRDAIVKAFEDGKMVLASETEDTMIFRGESPGRRIWFMGDEAVTVTRNPSGGFDLEGPRRFVMEAQYRIPRYTGNEE